MDDFEADFLAREQAALGADAALFGNPGNVTAAASLVPDQANFIDADFSGAFQSAPPMTFAPAPDDFAAFADATSFSPAFSQSSPPVEEVEPESVKVWREKFANAVADRDSRSATKHEEILRQAKESLERFYADYNDQKNRSIARNKESEKATIAARDAPGTGNIWERVVKQVDLNAGSSLGNNPARDSKLAGKLSKAGDLSSSDKKDDKAKKSAIRSKDTSRMKSLLLSLKNDKAAPGALVE
ncbi:clathrin light chain-domain-containing protein [Zopfochytrium polystomum]|nr:clathrin light chain-domain-containing protein [Zopfochytrium polystomum]